MYRTARALALPLLALALLAGCGNDSAVRDGVDGARTTAAPASEIAPAELDLSRFGYARGAADAPIVVIEFSDFGCPYCARFALETLPAIEEEFIATGQVRWQYVPFVMGSFPNGDEAALTAECAADQGRFWPMHDLLYERQREWRSSRDADPLFRGYAEQLDLDVAAFATCFQENRPGPRIARSNAVAAQLGVQATPSFLVNGRPVQGALPLEQFRLLLHWAGAAGP